MIEPETLGTEHQQGKQRENRERDHLLQHLEFDQRERASVVAESDPIGRDLETILEKGNAPTDYDHPDQRQCIEPLHGTEFQVAIPGKGHKDIRNDQQADSHQSFHKPTII